MRTIAIINQKGGSGKTTTTVNLAASLVEQKKRVLVIDLDPQASTSTWFGRQSTQKGLLSVMTEGLPLASIIVETDIPGLSLVPSSSWLISLEKALAHEVGAETILKERLELLRVAIHWSAPLSHARTLCYFNNCIAYTTPRRPYTKHNYTILFRITRQMAPMQCCLAC